MELLKKARFDDGEEGNDQPIDFTKLQEVVGLHRRRRFRCARTLVQHGEIGAPETIKKVKDMARLPKEKELTIVERIDREVTKNGGQLMMHLKTHPKKVAQVIPAKKKRQLMADESNNTLSTLRQSDNWWGLEVTRAPLDRSGRAVEKEINESNEV